MLFAPQKKFQAPNTKSQTIGYLEFGNWNLEFVWNL